MNKEKINYLNLLAVQEYVDDLAKYCEQRYLELKRKIDADEQKNAQLNYSYREYEYESNFDTGFKISTYDGSTSFTHFKDVASWVAARNNGTFPDLRFMEIETNLCWRSGKKDGSPMTEHIHRFKIRLEPNASYFESEMGGTDEEYGDVRQGIIDKLEGFPAIRTIFSKDA